MGNVEHSFYLQKMEKVIYCKKIILECVVRSSQILLLGYIKIGCISFSLLKLRENKIII